MRKGSWRDQRAPYAAICQCSPVARLHTPAALRHVRCAHLGLYTPYAAPSPLCAPLACASPPAMCGASEPQSLGGRPDLSQRLHFGLAVHSTRKQDVGGTRCVLAPPCCCSAPPLLLLAGARARVWMRCGAPTSPGFALLPLPPLCSHSLASCSCAAAVPAQVRIRQAGAHGRCKAALSQRSHPYKVRDH